ncbi:hypothetical protein Ddc_07196 [Ditylenchus destructor]|nr:hypothetical protein Ddc_07196 [Ditylenchus destructor]
MAYGIGPGTAQPGPQNNTGKSGNFVSESSNQYRAPPAPIRKSFFFQAPQTSSSGGNRGNDGGNRGGVVHGLIPFYGASWRRDPPNEPEHENTRPHKRTYYRTQPPQ